MRNIIAFLILVLVFDSCNSQEEVFIKLKLKQNDKLKVELTEYNEIYSNETLIVNDSSSKKYEIEVLSVKEDGYIISWKNKNNYNLTYSVKTPIDKIVNDIINSLEYEVSLDKCGAVMSVNNWEKVKIRYTQLFNDVLNNEQIAEVQKARYKERYEKLFNTEKKVTDAARNHLEIIFSKFCKQYSLKEQKKETVQMNIPNEDNKVIQAEMISKALSYQKGLCIVDFNYKYDKESLMKTNIKDLQLSMQYKFDLDKGWLKYVKLNNEIVQDEYTILHREEYKFL